MNLSATSINCGYLKVSPVWNGTYSENKLQPHNPIPTRSTYQQEVQKASPNTNHCQASQDHLLAALPLCLPANKHVTYSSSCTPFYVLLFLILC